MAKRQNRSMVLKMSNKVARAGNKTFNRAENRVMCALMKKVSDALFSKEDFLEQGEVAYRYILDELGPNDILEFEISAAELRELCGDVDRRNKNYYFEIAGKMQEKMWFSYYDENEDRFYRVTLFPKISTAGDGSDIRFHVYADIIKRFFDVLKSYVLIDLEEANRLVSNYAFLLFSNLKSRVTIPGQEYEVAFSTKQLKEMFNLTEKDYTTINKDTGEPKFNRSVFESHCIDKPCEEINEKTKMHVTYTREMDGRLVECYKFHFTYNGTAPTVGSSKKTNAMLEIVDNHDSFAIDITDKEEE